MNAVFNFTISGTGTWSDGSAFTPASRSVRFNAASEASEVIEIEVPANIKGLKVEETYSGNYTPDAKAKTAVYSGVEDGYQVYTVSYTNTLTDHGRTKGIINTYGNATKTGDDNGVEITSRTGAGD